MVDMSLVNYIVARRVLSVAVELEFLVASWEPGPRCECGWQERQGYGATYFGFALAGAACPSFALPGPYASPRAHLALEVLSRLKSTAAERISAISSGDGVVG